jgi:hypothetical protein
MVITITWQNDQKITFGIKMLVDGNAINTVNYFLNGTIKR